MKREPERGDLVQVDWLDIFEDSVGNPDAARLARRTSWGLFWGQKDDGGVPCLVTTTTADERDHTQSGFCIYPSACVTRIEVVKRRRTRRRGSTMESSVPAPETGTT